MATTLGRSVIHMQTTQFCCLLSMIQLLQQVNDGQVMAYHPVLCHACTTPVLRYYPMVISVLFDLLLVGLLHGISIGSVMVSGSNPNPDHTVGPKVKYPTEYRTELFYPSYFNERRPQPQGLLAQYSYGGPSFNVSLTSDDLFGDVENVKTAKVVIIRPGFATHAMVCTPFTKSLSYLTLFSFFFSFFLEHGPAICSTEIDIHSLSSKQQCHSSCQPTSA